MPKPMYVWSGSAWISIAAEVESLATYATQSYAAAQPGMKMVVPTSVAVGSGSGSVDTNGAVTFSGASSVSLNDCFSSTYQNYKIVMNLSAATSNDVQMRLRVSSTDAATNYNRRGLCVDSAGTVSNYGSANSGTFWYAGIQTASLNSAGEILLSSPFETIETRFNATSSGGTQIVVAGGRHTTAASYTGITFFTDTGTITGTVRVYGYKN